MTTVKELFSRVPWESVADDLAILRPEDIESMDGFKQAFEEILQVEPIAVEDPCIVTIFWVEPRDPGEEGWWTVHGVRNGESWSLGYTTWDEWVSLQIDEECLNKHGDVTTAAHILWEMTWSGFTAADVKAAADELASRADEIDEVLKDAPDPETDPEGFEKYAKEHGWVTMEEFFKVLEEDIEENIDDEERKKKLH